MGKEMKAREDNRDVFEKAMDFAVPVAGASIGNVVTRRIGRKLLPYRGETARIVGNDFQKNSGSTNKWVEDKMILEDLDGRMDKLTPEQARYYLRRLDEANGYGRTGIARGVLTTAGTAVGLDAGNELRNRTKRRK